MYSFLMIGDIESKMCTTLSHTSVVGGVKAGGHVLHFDDSVGVCRECVHVFISILWDFLLSDKCHFLAFRRIVFYVRPFHPLCSSSERLSNARCERVSCEIRHDGKLRRGSPPSSRTAQTGFC